MCSHYQGLKDREKYLKHFGVHPPTELGKEDLWPGYQGSFIRPHPHADVGDDAVPSLEAMPGLFGLVPHWATDTKIARSTYNCRSETAHVKPSFRDAWKWARHCIIPAEAIFEPDWRTGKAVATRIARADGKPMGIAGLWSYWTGSAGDLFSYTMLTINADQHELMNHFHKPTDEKRMVVILPPERYEDWLRASPDQCAPFLVPCPAHELVASTPEKTLT